MGYSSAKRSGNHLIGGRVGPTCCWSVLAGSGGNRRIACWGAGRLEWHVPRTGSFRGHELLAYANHRVVWVVLDDRYWLFSVKDETAAHQKRKLGNNVFRVYRRDEDESEIAWNWDRMND